MATSGRFSPDVASNVSLTTYRMLALNWALDQELLRSAVRKLLILGAGEQLNDVTIPSGNRREKLQGDRAGQHSIRINQRWRNCFRWTAAGPEDVLIVDYHRGGMMAKTMDPIKPGEILIEEFLIPLGISQNTLARALRVPPRRINEIVLGKRRITADTALRLSRFFAMSEGFWMNLQDRYDREVTRTRIADVLSAIDPWVSNARTA
jgi:addiction module HigA family antidote